VHVPQINRVGSEVSHVEADLVVLLAVDQLGLAHDVRESDGGGGGIHGVQRGLVGLGGLTASGGSHAGDADGGDRRDGGQGDTAGHALLLEVGEARHARLLDL